MNAHTQRFSLTGAAGALECALDLPDAAQFAAPRGIALIAHPHPLYGGTMDNKVTQTLARAFVALGYVVARINFRGVGASQGVHDHGVGETDDMQLLYEHMQRLYPGLPVALSGFSFGTFVQSKLQERLAAAGTPAERLALIGSAAGKWAMADIPADTILIHGELDDTIPLSAVFDWARPQDIPVINHIKQLVIALWHGDKPATASEEA